MKGVCEKCAHREGCKTPCRPVELYLAEDNLCVFEKTGIGENGEEITIVFARFREIPESMLPGISEKTDEPIDSPFTTEAGSPFASFKPDLKQTGIFIDRFFNKWSYEDLAVKYDTTVQGATKLYHSAVKRLLEVIEALDGKEGPRNFEPWKKMVEERSGSFPLGVKWFLLNKLFQMRPAEIAKMEGVKNPHGVRGMIIRVSDQLRCGEISLFEVDQGEAEAAAKRLESKRAQRRAQYAKNKDKINAKRRAAYVLKKST